MGIGVGGCLSCFILSFYLFSRRPTVAEPALGYTYLFWIKSHTFYGTYFEYFAMTYGFFVAFGFGAFWTIAAYSQGISLKSATYNWYVWGTALVSIPIYAVIWWVFS
jgi:magnesium-transporting ATPase (P-type)